MPDSPLQPPAGSADVLTVEDVAELLRVSRKGVTAAMRAGLPVRRVGRIYRFSRRAVLDWLDKGRARSA